MPIDLNVVVLTIGLVSGAYMFTMLLWSTIYPERRLWPPRKATIAIKLRVWLLTITIFAAAFFLGLLDWNGLGWPTPLRWGIGLPLILIGNLIVWWGVQKIGMEATSGEATGLVTDGLYRWSRNPQYVADMAILIGWAILSASYWTFPVVAVGIAVLAIAPLAEEPWLEEMYGEKFRNFKKRVRRYI